MCFLMPQWLGFQAILMILSSNSCISKWTSHQQPLCAGFSSHGCEVRQKLALSLAWHCAWAWCCLLSSDCTWSWQGWKFSCPFRLDFLSVCLEIFILVLIMGALALFWQRQVFLPGLINVRHVLHLKECRSSLLEAQCSRTGRWMIYRDVSVHDFPQKSRKRLPRENVSTWGELNLSSGYPCNSFRIFKVQSCQSKGSYASTYCFYEIL